MSEAAENLAPNGCFAHVTGRKHWNSPVDSIGIPVEVPEGCVDFCELMEKFVREDLRSALAGRMDYPDTIGISIAYR